MQRELLTDGMFHVFDSRGLHVASFLTRLDAWDYLRALFAMETATVLCPETGREWTGVASTEVNFDEYRDTLRGFTNAQVAALVETGCTPAGARRALRDALRVTA